MKKEALKKAGAAALDEYRAMSPQQKKDVAFMKIERKLEVLTKSLRNWGQPIHEGCAALVADVRKMRQCISALPKDFKPVSATQPKTIEVGSFVSVREDRRARYDDLIDDDDMKRLRVVGLANGRVKLSTPDGEYVGFLARGEVQLCVEKNS